MTEKYEPVGPPVFPTPADEIRMLRRERVEWRQRATLAEAALSKITDAVDEARRERQRAYVIAPLSDHRATPDQPGKE